jgi:hypothetical protein
MSIAPMTPRRNRKIAVLALLLTSAALWASMPATTDAGEGLPAPSLDTFTSYGCAIQPPGVLVCPSGTANPLANAPRTDVQSIGRSCLLLRSGQVLCYGDNARGQRGTGNQNFYQTPTMVPGIPPAVDIAGAFCRLPVLWDHLVARIMGPPSAHLDRLV